MASVASQSIEEATAHAQSDSLEDAREICAGGTYFPNSLHISIFSLSRDVYKSTALHLRQQLRVLALILHSVQ